MWFQSTHAFIITRTREELIFALHHTLILQPPTPTYYTTYRAPRHTSKPERHTKPQARAWPHMTLPTRPPVIHEDEDHVASSATLATVDPTPQQQLQHQHQHQQQEDEDDWVLSGEQSWGAQSSSSLNENESPDCTRHSEHHGVSDPFTPSSQCGGVHSMGRKRMSFTYVL